MYTDSSYLFQAGAYSPLLSTIEAVNDIVPEMVIIMLWDQNMTLFPELFRKITEQAKKYYHLRYNDKATSRYQEMERNFQRGYLGRNTEG